MAADSGKKRIHPYVTELKKQYKNGKITRRDFLRHSTLLGLSAAAALSFAPALFPKPASAMQPARGGVWRYAIKLKRIDHPARMNWTEASNVVSQVMECLTETGPDNITRPLLLEKWEVSDDLKTWDLFIRKGITFNNGEPLTADDVMFTFKEWLTEDVGSSMFGLLNYIGGYQNVEKIDDHHVRLNCNEPNIAVPEHLYHYPAVILPKGFKGDFVNQPVGTGPFKLAEFVDGERAVFEARDDYWQTGSDGKPLPYLDKLIYLDMDRDAALAALSAGQIECFYKPRPSDFLAAQGLPHVRIQSVDTSASYVVRMNVETEPWNDNRVRTALKKCQDRDKILKLAQMGEGITAIDAHVAPAQPEWCEKERPEYDPEGARKLLEEYAGEKGLQLPLTVQLASKNDLQEPEVALALRELAKPAGFDIQLDLTDPSGYWDRWKSLALGITHWSHRPLATMLLPLAYTKAALGRWNETHWTDDEFEELLQKAQKTIDIEKRRQIMCRIEDIMQERGPVAISYFYKSWEVSPKNAVNVKAHPNGYNTYLKNVWFEA